MQLRNVSVILLALLLAAMAMVPYVSAGGSANSDSDYSVDLNTFNLPILQFDNARTPLSMSNEFLITNQNLKDSPIVTQDDGKTTIPAGAIIHHAKDGITRVFDKTGKEIFTVDDEKSGTINTPKGPYPVSHIYEVPSGAMITDHTGKTFVVYQNEVICTVIDENNSSISSVKKQSVVDSLASPMVSPLVAPYYGWIEYAYDRTTTSTPLTLFDGYWNVPSDPTSRPGTGISARTIFLFNSIEDYPTYNAIIQPVLEWNNIDTGYYWDIASWSLSGSSGFHSTRITVPSGHTIRGRMEWSSSINAWYVTTYDITTGSSTSLTTTWMPSPYTTSLEESIALEGKQIYNNNDVPGDTVFSSMTFQSNGVTIPIVLKKYISSSAPLTQLNVEIITNPSQVKLHTAN